MASKEPVKLRRRALRNGGESLYFDICGAGRRRYEFLGLYLTNGKTAAERAQDAETLRYANAIKARRTTEILRGIAGGGVVDNKITLSEWMRIYCEKMRRTRKQRTYETFVFAARALSLYNVNDIKLCRVDAAFCGGFVEFLKTDYISNRGGKIKGTTVLMYIDKVKTALRGAIKEGLIFKQPFEGVETVKPKPAERCFLSVEELHRMIETYYYKQPLELAFLFSCFSGLRWSDICGLRWSDIVTENGVTWCNVTMKKTGEFLRLPLSDAALSWLPEGERIGCVFKITHSCPTKRLRRWARMAGVEKPVTFHTARHTFATLALTKGADLYTVSKLLGHKDIKTTQIYAKIVDESKVKAVNLLNDL